MSKQYSESEQSEEQQKTRERIIAAASKVLAEKGYEATTLREISREAQAAPGLVHYYFGGKDQLLVEVLQAAGQRFHQRLERLVENMPADRSLEAVLTQLHERVDQDPNVYRLRYESFALGLHNKEASLDPIPLAALLLSVFDGLALQKIMDPTFDLDAPYRLLAYMLHALFARDIPVHGEQTLFP